MSTTTIDVVQNKLLDIHLSSFNSLPFIHSLGRESIDCIEQVELVHNFVIAMLNSITSDHDSLAKPKWMADKEASDLHDVIAKLSEQKSGDSDQINPFQLKNYTDHVNDLQWRMTHMKKNHDKQLVNM